MKNAFNLSFLFQSHTFRLVMCRSSSAGKIKEIKMERDEVMKFMLVAVRLLAHVSSLILRNIVHS